MSTDETTRPRLDAIQARAAAATEGPWEEVAWIAPDGRRYDALVGPNGLDVCEVPQTPQGSADSAFIAHVRTDVPALTAALREVLALHVGIDRCCTECGAITEYIVRYPCSTVRAITAHIDVTTPTLRDPASPERGTP